jgi:MATE family multidrug resistance protein
MQPYGYMPLGVDASNTNGDFIRLAQREASDRNCCHNTNDNCRDCQNDPNLHTTITSSSQWHEVKTILKRSIPLNLAYLLRFSHSITTLYIIGSSSHQNLQAASLATAIANITGFAFFEGLVSSLDTLFSQAYGASKYQSVGFYAQKFLCFAGLLYVPVAVLWLFSSQILGIFMRDEAVAGLCGRYLRVLILAIPGHTVFEIGKRFVLVQGETLMPLYVTLVTTPIHFILSWCFVRVSK